MPTTFRDAPAFLFELRFRVGPVVTIRAFEAGTSGYNGTHTRIEVEVRVNGEILFARPGRDPLKPGLWCGIPAHQSVDGKEARECVVSLVALKPGDTDSDYFADYTADQLAFAEAYGEELSFQAAMRYGEAT